MTSLRKPRASSFRKQYCGYGGEKILNESCPRLSAGISLQTRRNLALANAGKHLDRIPSEEMVSSTIFKRHGSMKSKVKSEVDNNHHDILMESVLMILRKEVFNMVIIFSKFKLFVNYFQIKAN